MYFIFEQRQFEPTLWHPRRQTWMSTTQSKTGSVAQLTGMEGGPRELHEAGYRKQQRHLTVVAHHSYLKRAHHRLAFLQRLDLFCQIRTHQTWTFVESKTVVTLHDRLSCHQNKNDQVAVCYIKYRYSCLHKPGMYWWILKTLGLFWGFKTLKISQDVLGLYFLGWFIKVVGLYGDLVLSALRVVGVCWSHSGVPSMAHHMWAINGPSITPPLARLWQAIMVPSWQPSSAQHRAIMSGYLF